MSYSLTLLGLQTLFCRMSALQQDLYGFFYDSIPVKIATGRIQSSDSCKKLAVLPAISALKKLCCHPALVSLLSHLFRHGQAREPDLHTRGSAAHAEAVE